MATATLGGSMNKQLRLAILKKFDTQADFAAAVGEHPSLVSLVIRERTTLSDDRREKWAKILGVRKEELY